MVNSGRSGPNLQIPAHPGSPHFLERDFDRAHSYLKKPPSIFQNEA